MPIMLASQFQERPGAAAAVDELVGRYMPDLIRVFGDRTQDAVAAILNIPGSHPRLSEQDMDMAAILNAIEMSTLGALRGAECEFGEQFVAAHRESHVRFPEDFEARRAYRQAEFSRLFHALPVERRQELLRGYVRTTNAREWKATLGAIRARLAQALSEPSSFVSGVQPAVVEKADAASAGNPVRGALRDAADDGQHLASVDGTTRTVTGVPKRKKRSASDNFGQAV